MPEAYDKNRGLGVEFSHFDDKGKGKMVDISEKPDTLREAVARGRIYMKKEVVEKVKELSLKKGDAIAVSNVAGIMAAKKTSELIPMTHNINLTSVDMEFSFGENFIEARSIVRCVGKTGAEMEALTAVSVALLTIYDMCKAVDKGMVISDIHLEFKKGGKSGEFRFQ